MCLRGTYAYDWFEPDYYFYTWCRGLTGLAALALSIDFALSKTARMKVGETRLLAINGQASPYLEDKDSDSEGDSIPTQMTPRCHAKYLQRERPISSQVGSPDTLEAELTMRGYGWNFGKNVHVPKERRPLERSAFLRATLRLFIKKFLLADLFESCIKLLSGIGSTAGGSMFFTKYPRFRRYATSTGIQLLSGVTLVNGLEVVNLACTLVGVGIYGQSPKDWPFILDDPFDAESLHDLWSRRWHQCLRRVFIVFGGIPGEYFFGRNGMVFGTFLASGLFHEAGAYLMGRGIDYRVPLFFVLQACGIWIEEWWRNTMGWRMGGTSGTLWAYFWVVGLGQMCMDSWFQRGLAGAIIIPSQVSFARQILFPSISFIWRMVWTLLGKLM
ncbi:hypothetical protein QCA50_005030 [Cerrena zonata]|uniref:Wax synthase domain-containing protein n=1 Tax=Cerrena zonata TaxID=2478898 RepID=A0AAW0GFV4_9APHY